MVRRAATPHRIITDSTRSQATTMRVHCTLLVALALGTVQLALSQATQVQSKQTATGLLTTLSSMVPSVVSNVLPLVFMFSLGALLVPTLGLTSLLRDGKRRSLPAFSLDTSGFTHSIQEVFEKFKQAIDKMDQKNK